MEIIDLRRAYHGDVPTLLESHPTLTDRGLRLAGAYSKRFPEEVERHLSENRRSLEELRELYPFLQVEQDESN